MERDRQIREEITEALGEGTVSHLSPQQAEKLHAAACNTQRDLGISFASAVITAWVHSQRAV